MQLNHVNLTVDDVPGKRNFDVLIDDEGLVLTLIGVGRNNSVSYPETFHIGFLQATNEDVDAVNRRLREDGYDVPPPSRQHGAWTFYFDAPGGFTIEVLC